MPETRLPSLPRVAAGRCRCAHPRARSSGTSWCGRSADSWCRSCRRAPISPSETSPFDLQTLRDEVRAARAEAPVVLAVALSTRVLHEPVGAPRRLRVVAELHDRIGTLALLLRQRHDRRVVFALVVRGRRCATSPVVAQLIADVSSCAVVVRPILLRIVRLGAQRDRSVTGIWNVPP